MSIRTKVVINLMVGALATLWLAYREIATLHPNLFH